MNKSFVIQQTELHKQAVDTLIHIHILWGVKPESDKHQKVINKQIEFFQAKYHDILKELIEPIVEVSGIIVTREDCVTIAEEFYA